jgi:hypothetical protein
MMTYQPKTNPGKRSTLGKMISIRDLRIVGR